jgi:hypothetical protein
MFIKAFSPDHFNHGGDAPFEILRFSTKGLDKAQEKRANMFSKLVEGYTPSKDKTAVHTIAMTAFEKFGFNRNGDGWKRANLLRDHPTFISHAKVYRHHKNTPADPSFGVVKAAMYNEDMDRVELLMELDNTKCAEELSLLERDGSYPVSMACKIAYDVCSICSNKAKTPREYCHHVKEAMGKILDDGRIVGVDNPNSTFFDISRVIRPADRVAYTLKTASASGLVGGAALAEELGYTLNYTEDLNAAVTCSVKASQDKKAILDKLSKMEKRIEGTVTPILMDNPEEVQDCVKKLSAYIPVYLDSVMKAMCKEAVVLRPSEFYTLMTGNSLNSSEAATFNKLAFNSAINSYPAEELTNSGLYEPAVLGVGGKIAEICSNLKQYRSVSKPILGRIAGTAKFSNCFNKSASTGLDSNWAKEYVRYQLEMYKNIKTSFAASELDEALFCGLCQNTVE